MCIMAAHHEEVLLRESRPKTYVGSYLRSFSAERGRTVLLTHSSRSEAFKHTARGLEAIGFNAQASMYHVDREYSPESDDERANKKKNKQKKSFLKKLVGGGKEKGQKI